MKTNTHLFNLIHQILEAREKGNLEDEARLRPHALQEIDKQISGATPPANQVNKMRATIELDRTLKLFTE